MDETPNSASQPELQQTPPQLPPIKKPRGKIAGIIAACIIVVVAAAVAIFMLVSHKQPKPSSLSAKPASTNAGTQERLTSDLQASGLPQITLATATPEMIEKDLPLAQIANYQALLKKYNLTLSQDQQQFLQQNHFLLLPGDSSYFPSGYNFDDMLRDFDTIGGQPMIWMRKPEDTKFVTPDIMLEAYHKFFDLTLKQLEQTDLSANLSSFLTGLNGNLLNAEQHSSDYTQQRYQNLLAQMTVARVLLENKSPAKPQYFDSPDKEDVYTAADKTIDSADNAKTIATKYTAGLTPDLIAKVNQELDLIYASKNVTESPLFGQYSPVAKSDYTQYTPRSHYTENSTLRAYFRTMMYLGRNSYLFQSDDGIADANLLIKQMSAKASDGSLPLDTWNKIMAVTSFYAGQSDDVTYSQWQKYVTATLGSSVSDADLTTSTNISKLAQNLDQLPQPKILSSVIIDPTIFSQTKADLLRKSLGLRVFGQRFTFDAWVLNDLTAGQEKTETKLPSTPSALFIPAAFGSNQARQYTQTFLKDDAGFSDSDVQGFMGKLDQKQADIAKVTPSEWYGSMGSSWLYVLGSLTKDFKPGYPLYMQNTPFLDKELATYFGSYTELKHDTLLYAKQSYAEAGAGGDDLPPAPVVKGFVEPNLDFWNRFNMLLARAQQLFTDNHLFADNSATARLQQFQTDSQFLTGLAQKELQNQPISDDDYEQLRNWSISYMVQPFDSVQPDENTGKVALIADIHTDVVNNKILYEGTGKPYLMLAIVGNENTPRLVAGLAFNHYEFTNPLTTRLSDQDWQKSVYDQPDQLPQKNFWYRSLGVK